MIWLPPCCSTWKIINLNVQETHIENKSAPEMILGVKRKGFCSSFKQNKSKRIVSRTKGMIKDNKNNKLIIKSRSKIDLLKQEQYDL